MLKSGLIFLAGVAVGAVGAYAALSKKFAINAEAEESFQEKRETARSERESEAAAKAKADQNKADILTFAKKIQEEGYKTEEKDTPKNPEPYVIPPEEFGEIDNYERISLTFFKDGFLCEGEDPIDNVKEVVGDALDHFGEYEEDSVYVRNDLKKCDYEILMDLRNFSDIVREKVVKIRQKKREDE